VKPRIKKRAADISKYYDDLFFATQLGKLKVEGLHTVRWCCHTISNA